MAKRHKRQSAESDRDRKETSSGGGGGSWFRGFYRRLISLIKSGGLCFKNTYVKNLWWLFIDACVYKIQYFAFAGGYKMLADSSVEQPQRTDK